MIMTLEISIFVHEMNLLKMMFKGLNDTNENDGDQDICYKIMV